MGYQACFVKYIIAVKAVRQHFKTVVDVDHIPMNPDGAGLILHKIIKVGKKSEFNLSELLFDLILINMQALSYQMSCKANRLIV